MKERVLYVVGAVIYVVIAVSFILFITSNPGSDAVMFASVAVSSALMLLTLIFGILVLRGSPSEEYKRRYIDGREDEEKK